MNGNRDFDLPWKYVLINATNGDAVGIFANSISARTALDVYLRKMFAAHTSSLHVDIFMYKLREEGGVVSPLKWTFTRDNYRSVLSTLMI